MVSKLPPAFQRAEKAMRLSHIDAQRDNDAQMMAYDAMDATDPQEKLHLALEAIEYYPFCTDAWNVLGYHYLYDGKNFEASIQAFQASVEAARRTYPIVNPERSEPLSWGILEARPYFRAVKGLARAYASSGQMDAAIETAELLTKRQCTFFNEMLVGWLMRVGRWEDARKLLQQTPENLNTNCGIAYQWLLIYYHDYVGDPDSEETDKQLYKALGKALEKNVHVPSLLAIDNIERRTKPNVYQPGNEDEALLYVIDHVSLWRSTRGAIRWLSSTKNRYGPKPNEECFVQMLRTRLVYVEFSNGTSATLTQNRKKMFGGAHPSFKMRKECLQPHVNGSIICAQKRDFDEEDSLLTSPGTKKKTIGSGFTRTSGEKGDKWFEFKYDNVASVPFWSMFPADDESETQNESPAVNIKSEE